MRKFVMSVAAICLAGSAMAGGVEGVWKTEPDRKDFVSHIKIDRCGAAMCGTILQVFDQGGNPVKTKSLGKRLFWDMKPIGDGRYGEGTVWVPMLDVTTRNGEMQVAGNRLYVQGRVGPIKGQQIWTRVR